MTDELTTEEQAALVAALEPRHSVHVVELDQTVHLVGGPHSPRLADLGLAEEADPQWNLPIALLILTPAGRIVARLLKEFEKMHKVGPFSFRSRVDKLL